MAALQTELRSRHEWLEAKETSLMNWDKALVPWERALRDRAAQGAAMEIELTEGGVEIEDNHNWLLPTTED